MEILDKKTNSYLPFTLWTAQRKLLSFLLCAKKMIILKTRQCGGTELSGAYALGHAMFIPNFIVLVLSKTGDDAIEFLKRVRNKYLKISNHLEGVIKLVKDTTEELEFNNGSRIKSLPANRGEGYTADLVIIDEAARITKRDSKITLEEVLSRVEPALKQSKGQLILVSKASGTGKFKSIYQTSKIASSGWKNFFISCYDDPNFTKADREQVIRDFGKDHADENYPENDIQAFLSSGRPRFNVDILMKYLNGVLNNNKFNAKTGYLDCINNKVDFRNDEKGYITIIELPKFGESYCIGADIAEGIENESKDTDYSGAIVLNSTLKVVAKIHCRLEPDIFAEELRRLSLFYNDALTAPERNKDGNWVIKILINAGINLYKQENLNPDTHVREKTWGWLTTGTSKRDLLNWADEIIRNELSLITDEVLINELIDFVWHANGKVGASSGCHDDLAMAYCIALWVSKFIQTNHEKPVSKEDRFWDNYKTIQDKNNLNTFENIKSQDLVYGMYR
jgi:hypothetical protein